VGSEILAHDRVSCPAAARMARQAQTILERFAPESWKISDTIKRVSFRNDEAFALTPGAGVPCRQSPGAAGLCPRSAPRTSAAAAARCPPRAPAACRRADP